MEKITLQEITCAVNGKLIVNKENYDYTGVSIDSRKIEKGNIFIAFKGEKFNGNSFVSDVIQKGAVLCIVDEMLFDEKKINESNCSIILVDDTKKALCLLAKAYRQKLNVKIIGITGSTGKTSTKDFTASVLSVKYKVFKTIGNHNNDIGMPLMLLKIDNSYDVAVLEMGMSHINEIHNLVDICRPDVGIITNIGISHIENLKTQDNIFKAKMEITDFFNKNSILIVNGDDKYLSTINTKDFMVKKAGTSDTCDIRAKDIVLKEEGSKFSIYSKSNEKIFDLELKLLGIHNVMNACVATACASAFNIEYDDIQKGFNNIKLTSMRLDIIRGEKFIIIDDSYNASPDSMKAALAVLKNIKCKRRVAILGTMRELGDKSFEAHFEVGEYARNNGIDFLISVGEYSEAYKKGFDSPDFIDFENTENTITQIGNIIENGDAVLIKASRAMKFENIVNKLKDINC